VIIFGTRRTVQQLAMVLLTCVNCHRSAANAVLKLVTKFTLFFIQLFPVRVRYSTQCTACGFAMTVDKAQAEQLAQLPPAGATPQYPPQQHPQQQYPPPYPQQQYPGAHG
jgi:zinc-ribbon family